MKKFLSNIIACIITIYLATLFIPGVYLDPSLDKIGRIKVYLISGIILGFLNYFIKPILKFLALPVIILSIGFFSFFINFFIVWLIDILIPQLYIVGFLPTLFTAILLTIMSLFVNR
ncbi:MAG: phage holin family protein [Minisyncoccia bacterium]